MSYRRLLLTRYSRRDYLSIVIVGVTVAFLTGSALLLVAGTVQTQAIAADFDTSEHVTSYDSIEAATAEHDDAVVISTATIQIDGDTVTAIGVPPATNETIAAATPERGLASATATATETVAIHGAERTMPGRVMDRPTVEFLPEEWYFGNRTFVDRLGTDGAFVVNTTGEGSADGVTVPLRSAALFFLYGSQQVLTIFGLITGGVGLLVAVIVYSVTRMSIQDRYQTIKVIRATGGTPSQVRRLFTLRAVTVAFTGIAIGYAGGLIVTRTAVNLGVFLGLPVSLDVSLSATTVGVLVPGYLGILLLSVAAGYLAVWTVSRTPPGQIQSQISGESETDGRLTRALPSQFDLELLGWQSLVPTIATVTVFLTLLILVFSALPVIAPIVNAETATVMEPGAVHPVSSDVSESFAAVLQEQGIEASPEILLFPVVDEKPILTRGVEYESFAAVSDATIQSGRAPTGPDEAVIGTAAAKTHDITVGDWLPLGGSTNTAYTRVRVVGTFDAPGLYDDHLLVSLPTGRQLTTRERGRVHVVRAERLPEQGESAISVTGIDVSETVVANETVPVEITAINIGQSNATRTVIATLASESQTVQFDIAAGARSSKTITLTAPEPGNWTLQVGTTNRSVAVVRPDRLQVSLPDRAPPESTIRVDVQTASGTAVANASVTLGVETTQTNAQGIATLPVGESGQYDVVVRANDQTVTHRLVVSENDSTGAADGRQPLASLSFDPMQPNFQVRPTATLQLENPWATPITIEATLSGPQEQITETVTLQPNETATVTTTLRRNPPGQYEVEATDQNGTVLASETLTVTGDERLVSALATYGERTSTPFSKAVSLVFGNLRLLVGAILGLGGVMTIGGLTATFARSVQSRRRTIGIYRATGARPRQIFGVVLRDATILGMAATLVAFPISYGLLALLSSAELLVAFGISIKPVVGVQTIVLGFSVVLGLVLIGAAIATISLIRAQPATVLADDHSRGEPQ